MNRILIVITNLQNKSKIKGRLSQEKLLKKNSIRLIIKINQKFQSLFKLIKIRSMNSSRILLKKIRQF